MIKRFREIKRKKAKRRMKRKALKLLFNLFLLATGLFAVTFTVYFFNLDMKLTSMIEPFLLRHYDSIERNQHL
jgi:hypothetical protein